MTVKDDRDVYSRSPVAVATGAITVSSGESSASAGEYLNARFVDVYFRVPELDGTDTAELKIKGPYDEEILASGEKDHVDGAVTEYQILNVARLPGAIVLEVECSGAQAADREFTFVMNGE